MGRYREIFVPHSSGTVFRALPSDYAVEYLIAQDKLEALDKEKLTNLSNIDPTYLDESYDVAHDKVSQFVRIHGITKNDVDSYIREFTIAIFKYYYELRLDDVFA